MLRPDGRVAVIGSPPLAAVAVRALGPGFAARAWEHPRPPVEVVVLTRTRYVSCRKSTADTSKKGLGGQPSRLVLMI